MGEATRRLARRCALGWLAGVLVMGAAPACDTTRANGAPCLKNRDCDSGLCRSGVCVGQPGDSPPPATGGTGATTTGAGGTGAAAGTTATAGSGAGAFGTGGVGGAGGSGGAGGGGG